MSLSRPYKFAERYLEPTTILNEAVFGLVMSLTFTLGAGLIVKEGPDATRELLIGVLGCNLAWGLIDGMIMVMGGMLERSKKSQLIIRLRGLDDEGARLAAVQQEVEPVIAPYVEKAERAAIYSSIAARLRDGEPERIHPKREEVLGAFATAWIVFAAACRRYCPFFCWKTVSWLCGLQMPCCWPHCFGWDIAGLWQRTATRGASVARSC